MRTRESIAPMLPFRSDEKGSLTIFSLFIFLMLLMVSGMAVDMMRQERMRVDLQNTIDTAVVAASSLTQALQSEADVDALVRDHVLKAGFDPSIVTVDSDLERAEGSDIVTSRFVNASANFEISTIFMGLLGIDELEGTTASGAQEGQQFIEIALVLDNSGSMSGQKLLDLQDAAKQFVTTVLDNNAPERTLISIIPYTQQVHMDADLMVRLGANSDLSLNTDPVVVDPSIAHPGALTSYVPGNLQTNCARFRPDDFDSRRLVSDGNIELMSHFSQNFRSNYSEPQPNNRWCRPTGRTETLLFQNDETILHEHIDSMTAGGWTAVDYGMNWGVGVLDPSFQPIVTEMIEDGDAPATAEGFPVNHGTPGVLKYVILMTDGINTRQRDLKDEFKSGPTRIWHAPSLETENEFDGYLVEMPDAPAGERWYLPGQWDDATDHSTLAEGDLPADAVQLDHHRLFNRFDHNNVAEYFFRDVDQAAYDAYSNAVNLDLGYDVADTDLRTMCDRTRENDWIEIFTIAFEAPTEAETILAECSAISTKHFDVAGLQGNDGDPTIATAFAAIAAQITQLRLTQ